MRTALLGVLLVLGACSAPPPTLVSTREEPPGTSCPAGGVRIDVGPDTNESGVLDAAEITSTSFACNGQSGYITQVADEPPGASCPEGGLRIEVGPDIDGNGTLDFGEPVSTDYVCHGRDGEDGVSHVSLVTSEPPGANCADGGLRIDNGPDTDGSGTLEGGEIATTGYVCNGAAGADGTNGQDGRSGSLLDVRPVGPGGSSPTGGLPTATGVNTDGDGVLDPGEVTSTEYACNGASGGGGGGSAPVVSAYNGLLLTSTVGASQTLQQVTLAAPGAGNIVAIGTADVFCASPAAGLGYDCAAGTTDGVLTVTATAGALADTGSYSYFWLSPNTTENLTRTGVFPVAGAGSYTFYLRARADAGQMGFWRRQLTLMFFPG